MYNSVMVGMTKCTGKGIFAKKKFERGETIFTIAGRKKAFNGRVPSKVGPRWIGIGKNKWINPFRNNPAWYINHSCNPNSGRSGLFKIVGMKKILLGEEITIDYSITEEDQLWSMKCFCGEKKCRKIIKSISHLPLKSYKLYQKYIPKFLQESFWSAKNNNP
ncbi:SET domain-containing protein-lysine N-methyltransferase [Candidatus Peribacteria bacterium]|nr:SET domain-containing protein-lysine N-methyltransferase [Candidatus Peribacteria bacterium]